MTFQRYSAVGAALGGQAMTLVPKELVAAELADGTLMVPGDISYAAEIGYWFCLRTKPAPRPVLSEFTDWFLQTVSDQTRHIYRPLAGA